MLKFLLLFPVLLSIACARPANKEAQLMSASVGNPVQSTNVLWQHHGGNLGATNVVNGRLPSNGSIEIGETMFGFNIYCAPLVVEIDGNQHVYALWTNTNTLKVVKYTYSSGKLTTDSEFSSITLTSSNNHKAHQMAVTIKDNEPILFVAHGRGITRFNGLTGETLHTYTAANNVYRLTITNNNILIAQSATKLLKLNANNLTVEKELNISDYHPTNQLPVVISGDNVFFEHDKFVKKTGFTNFNSIDKDNANNTHNYNGELESQIFGPNGLNGGHNINPLDESHKNKRIITAMSAIKLNGIDTVIYAVSLHFNHYNTNLYNGLVNTRNTTAFFLFDVRPNDAFNLKSSDGSSTSPYGKYCAQFVHKKSFVYNQNDKFKNEDLNFSYSIPDPDYKLIYVRSSVCANGTGELSYTPLAVGPNNTLYLPGVAWNYYSCGDSKNRPNCDENLLDTDTPYFLSGIQKLNPNSAPAQAFEPDTHHVSGDGTVEYQHYERTGRGRASTQFFFSNRFVLRDEGQEITFAVANISDYFFDQNRFNHNSQSFVDYISTDDTPREDTYCIGYGIPQIFPDSTPCNGQGDYTPKISQLLEANLDTLKPYNSKVLVGTNMATNQRSFANTDMEVNAVSVGNNVVFLAGSDNNLYFFH
jgi:hypothetical protein